MKIKQLTRFSSASLALLALSLGSAQANVTWVGGATGVWEDPDNWLSNDTVPVNRLPVNGEWIRPTAVASITYSAASGTTTLPGSTLWQDTGAGHATHIQTGGDLTLASLYVNQLKSNTTAPAYTISGGKLTVNNFIQTWSNSSSLGSTFLQTGGEVVVNNTMSMALKSSSQVAIYELQNGSLTAGTLLMGNGSANSVTEFTQSAGTATINNYIRIGRDAGTTGSSIYNLDGGELTIAAVFDPFVFTQPGAPVHFDFDGGALNLRGTWDFASLTAIANSDFRVAGMPATVGNLHFEAVTINAAPFTRISTVMEPPRVITEVIYDEGADEATLTWSSQPGLTYGVYWSDDLANFTMMPAAVPAHPSADETTHGPFPSPDPGAGRLFFRYGDPDTEDPTLTGALGNDQLITVTFSEAMNPGPASNLANYQLELNGGAPLGLATAGPGASPETVVLTTVSPMNTGASYTLTINNVTDTAGRAIAPDSEATINVFDPTATVQVYILAGQSNMEGKAKLSLLEQQADNEPNIARFAHLRDPAGDWIVRDDIWVKFLGRHGKLTPGFGSPGAFGPELEFGLTVARNSIGPVLLIKTAWGGKSLYRDFRPPSSGDNPDGALPSDGDYYRAMLQEVGDTLANLGTLFPDYQGQGYAIRGLAWFQGWNDQNAPAIAEYADNMANFIRDVRIDLGIPKLPFVIGQLGVGGVSAPPNGVKDAQAAAAALPEFAGNVALVPTDIYWDAVAQAVYDLPWDRDAETIALWQTVGSDRPYHYLGSAITFSDIGSALGIAVVDLINAAP